MKKFKLVLFLLLTGSLFAQQTSSLPHYLSRAEKALYSGYHVPRALAGNPVPPPQTVRTMAEWEELQGLMITWTSYLDILSQVVDYAQEEVTVYIVCSDSNQVKSYLLHRGVELKNLKFLIEDFDTVWCRDYGPWSAYTHDVDTLDIIDWIYNRPRPEDDVIPAEFAAFMHLPEYEATQDPDDLVHTGGNFMVDGHGTAFSSKLILEENTDKNETQIDDIMWRYLGIDRYIKMDVLPYDQIHHIDMHMKLLDEETLLVGQYPQGVADGPQIEANLQYVLDNYRTCFGRDYRVVRIPMPPDANGNYPDENGDYRTYTNSVIVNKTVIVPTYEEQYDTTALRIYREAMPGYRVVGIDCNDIITALGAIHCITKEIGVNNPVWISHAPIRHAYVNEAGYAVTAQIKSAPGISNAYTYWSIDTTAGFSALKMTALDHDSFTVSIPQQASGTEVFYYISAESNNGHTVSKPLVAPKGVFSFTVESASALSASGTPVGSFKLFANYPNPFGEGLSHKNGTVTTIRYHLPLPDWVRLSIYNTLGQMVKSLVNCRQNAGEYRIKFDASGLPSGLYIYRLSTKRGMEEARKMLLIR